MPDEQNGRDAQGSTSNTSATSGMQNGGAQDNPFASWPREDLEKEIRKLRDEVVDRRKNENAAKEAAAAAARAEQERLAALGQWEQLAKQRETELAQYLPYKERATALESLITENNQRIIQQIPEQMRTLVPQLPPEQLAQWLTANQALLTRKAAPETDAGAGQGGGAKNGVASLTPEELAMAQAMGLTPEKFAAAKDKK